MAEVIDHLVRVETSVVRMMRGNLARDEQLSTAGRLRSAMVLLTMYLPTRVRVPRSAETVQPRIVAQSLAELEAEWYAAGREMERFLDSLSEAELKKALFKHPVGGWSTAAGALAFVRAHLYHHTYQLARLEKRMNKKAG
jgi:hypothetical protein